MKAVVFDINWRRGMVAVLTENGDFSIFEMLGDDNFEKGDEVFWKNDTALGSEKIRNATKGETMEVFFQNHWVPKNQLRQQLLYE